MLEKIDSTVFFNSISQIGSWQHEVPLRVGSEAFKIFFVGVSAHSVPYCRTYSIVAAVRSNDSRLLSVLVSNYDSSSGLLSPHPHKARLKRLTLPYLLY